MTRQSWLVGAVCLAMVSVGCGEDDSGPTLTELPPILADAICEVFSDCFGAAAPRDLVGDDCITTQTAVIQDGDFRYLQDSIDAGRVSYHAGKVQRCVDDIKAAGCAGIGTGGLPASCEEAVSGALEIGDLCGLDEECAGDAYCRMNAACPGTCTALSSADEACTEDDQCARGLGCQDGVCRAPAAEGSACGGTDGRDCVLGAHCLDTDDDPTTMGTCTPYDDLFSIAEGETCSLEDTEYCAPGLSCAATVSGTPPMATFKCEAQVAAGAACKLAVPDQCPAGQFCDVMPDMGEFAATCKPLPTDGQPCSASSQLCAARHQCDNDVCRPVNRIGGACSSDAFCSSDTCEDGKCVAPVACDPDA